jgi:hypothetical protein
MSNEENEAAGGPAEESKEDKFKRLAESRVNNAIAKIGLIGNLAGPNYAYTADQAEKIVNGLKAAVEDVEKKFHKGLNRKGFNDEGKFRL